MIEQLRYAIGMTSHSDTVGVELGPDGYVLNYDKAAVTWLWSTTTSELPPP